jgi:DNA-binding NarL/FixJ family response regulator
MNRCRVLLVDDSRAVLEALGRFLAAVPEVEVVGQGCSGPEALAQAARLKPDLVILDLVLPGVDGLEVTRRLKASPGGPLVLVLTPPDDPEHRAAARAAGADNLVGKQVVNTALLAQVRTLLAQGSAGEAVRPA